MSTLSALITLHPSVNFGYLNIPAATIDNFENRLEAIGFAGKIPEEFVCPITLCIMSYPVIAGPYIYERNAIKRWVKSNHTNPLNRDSLELHQLIPNTELKNKIRYFMEDQEVLAKSRLIVHPTHALHTLSAQIEKLNAPEVHWTPGNKILPK